MSVPLEAPPSDGWILDEDRAIRDQLMGMFVKDQEKRARKVESWYSHPDQEIREQHYPYVTLDLLSIEEANERVQRGDLYLDVGNLPPQWYGYGPLPNASAGWITEMPTPINLNYQITTWARNPRHDRQMLQQVILGGRIMVRGGWLNTADGRIRRLDFRGHTKRDVVDAGSKRLFSNVFRITVSSEIPWKPVLELPYALVESLHFRFTPSAQPSDPYDPTPNPEDLTWVIPDPDDDTDRFTANGPPTITAR